MLASRQNPLIKQIRKLDRVKERRKQNLSLFEGTNVIEAACQVGYPLQTLCYTEAWRVNYPQLWQQASQRSQRVELVTPEVLKAIATTVNPDGVVATAIRDRSNFSSDRDLSLGLVVERLQDPGNLGTMIRTAVATGVETLWLSRDSVDRDHPKLIRASAGEWFKLPITTTDNCRDLVQSLRDRNLQIVATLPTAQKTYWELDFTQPTVILLGNEGAGLSEHLAALANERVTIPLTGGVESLNVAIATALILYEIRRQRTFCSHK